MTGRDTRRRAADFNAMVRAGEYWQSLDRAARVVLKRKLRARVAADALLTSTAQRLSELWLVDYLPYGHALPSASTAARRLSLHRTAVMRAADLLCRHGHWRKLFRTGRGRTCIYWPNWESVAPRGPRDPETTSDPAQPRSFGHKVSQNATLMRHDSMKDSAANQLARQGGGPGSSPRAEPIDHPAEQDETKNQLTPPPSLRSGTPPHETTGPAGVKLDGQVMPPEPWREPAGFTAVEREVLAGIASAATVDDLDDLWTENADRLPAHRREAVRRAYVERRITFFPT